MPQKIPWPRLFAEGAIIIVSVLLALWADAWWGARQEREAEGELLTALAADMQANLDESVRVAAREAESEAALRVFIDATPEQLASLPPDSAETLLRRVGQTPVFTPFRGAIDTGDLSLLSAPRLRHALGFWDGLASDVVENTPLLLENIRGVRLTMGSAALTFLTGYSQQAAGPLLAQLRSDESYMTGRLTLQMTRNVTMAKVRQLSTATQSVLDLLEESQR